MQPDHVMMSSNGRLVIPAKVRQQLGMPNGGSFVMRVENGEVRLEPIAQAIARVQALVRRYVPEGVSLVDELSAERRIAAESE